MGTPESSVPSLKSLLSGPDRVIAVVTKADSPRDRGHKLRPSPIKRLAQESQLPILQPGKVREPSFLQTMQKIEPDWIVVVAYGKILPSELLRLPTFGCVNLHFSLLPKHRGASPVTGALLEGDRRTGVTTMLMNQGMDTGDILLQQEVQIRPDETAGELEKRLSEIGARLLADTLKALKQKSITPLPQSEELATYTRPVKKEDGRISWVKNAAAIERMIRAYNPWPSAYTSFRGRLLKIHRAHVVDITDRTQSELVPGSVVKSDSSEIVIMTGGQGLSPDEVQLENRRKLNINEFLKGCRIQAGDRFE